MISLYVCFALLLVIAVESRYCKSDQCVNFPGRDNVTITLQIINRSRFGYTVVSLANLKDTQQDLHFVSYVKDDRMVFHILNDIGNGSFIVSNSSEKTRITQINSLFQMPLSNYLSFQGQDVFLNISWFEAHHNDSLNVRLRMNVYGGYPISWTTFTPVVDEDYNVNITNNVEAIRWPPNTMIKITPMHPAWLGINLGIYVMLFFVLVPFSKMFPLNSRGAIPYLALLGQISMELSNIFIFLPLETLQREDVQIGAIYYRVGTYLAGLSTLCLLSTLLFVRYLILLFLNKRKLLFQAEDKVATMKWYWKAIKLAGSPWVGVLFAGPWYLLMAIICALAQLAGDGQFEIVWKLTILFCGTICIVVFIIEFVVNFNKKEGIWGRFVAIWKEDVLYFKFEIYGVGICILLPMFVSRSIVLIIGLQFAHNLINTIEIYGIMLSQVICPLAITIYLWIRRICNKTPKKDGEFRLLLQDATGFDLLKKFSEFEFSSENLLCYQNIQKFKEIKSLDEQQKYLSNFIVLHLNGRSSELEINVSRDIMDELNSKIKLGEIDSNVLQGVEFAIVQNIRDTYSRFRNTGEYIKYVKEKNVVTEML